MVFATFSVFFGTLRNLLTRAEKSFTIKGMKHERRYRSTGGGGGLNRLRIAPYLQILLGLAILAAVIWFLYAVVYPVSRNLAHGISPFATPTPIGATPVPSPTPSPTPDPAADHPLYTSDLTAVQREIVIPEYQYLADPFVYDGKIYFVAGNYTIDGTAAFVRLVTYSPESALHNFLALPLTYKSIRYPVMNEKWIVYLDATASGGGRIAAFNRITQQAYTIKTVHVGMPKPQLMGDIAIWMERTGQSRDKLFACDLNTGETVTLEIYDNSEYGMSDPCVFDDTLYYVDPDGKLTAWTLSSNDKRIIETGTYVHDPKCNGNYLAYLSANHGEDSELMLVTDDGIVPVASGVYDFALGDTFLAYSRYNRNYVYFPADGTTFCTTRSDETSMVLGAGEKYLIWMDVTWRDKDISEFMIIE